MPWASIQDGDAAALAGRVLPADRAVGHLPAASCSRGQPAAHPRPDRPFHGPSWPRRGPSHAPDRAGSMPARASSGSGIVEGRAAACVSSMRIVRGLDQYPPDAPPSVVAQGTFDGIHLGHQAVIRTAVGRARALGAPGRRDLRPESAGGTPADRGPAGLLPLDERLERIAELGPEVCLVIPFTAEFAGWRPRPTCRRCCSGSSGRERSSSASTTPSDAARAALRISSRDWAASRSPGPRRGPVEVDGVTVSSTSIREALRQGDVGRAGSLLGRPYTLRGIVARGPPAGGPRVPDGQPRRPAGPPLADGVSRREPNGTESPPRPW